MNSLLDVVRGLAGLGSVVGKRDYALLIFYLLTGLRRSEVIGLRGKDLEFKEGALVIKYRRKGGKFTAREVSDPVTYDALKDYLEAAGRMRRRIGAPLVDATRPCGQARRAVDL
jgi:integrase